MEMDGSRSMGGGGSGSSDSSPLDGLKFGKKIYFEDLGSNAQTTSSSSSSKQPVSSSSPSPPPPRPSQAAVGASSLVRRGRGASAQGGAAQQPPRCQVEGCGLDLTGAKAYYCRHKVCGTHSKSPTVVVAGIEQRFCQQCSRFHQLAEFDQGKRSCRRRLAGHNERRRKPPSGSFTSRYGQLSSYFHDDARRFGGFVMDFSSSRLHGNSRDHWPATEASDRTMTRNQWQSRPDISQSGRLAGQVVVPYNEGLLSSGTVFSAHDIPPDECLGVSDSSCALSLLSSQQWGTTAASSRGLSISTCNYAGPSIGQSSNTPPPFMGNPWSSHRHETNQTGPPVMFELRQTIEPDRNQFSNDPGLLVPPSNNRLWEHEQHGKGLGPSDHHMHWPH